MKAPVLTFVCLLTPGVVSAAETLGEPPDKDAHLRDSVAEAPHKPVDRSASTSTPGKNRLSSLKSTRSFVPPGFRELLEPQTTEVDIYYGDRYLVSSLATFTPTEITFREPDEILEHVPDLLHTDRVRAELQGPLPTNSELVCLKRNQTGCGSIEPETVDVIFDESRFRADLFIAPHLLAVRGAVDSKYLPHSSAGFSLLNLIAATINGQEGQDETYNLRNSTTLAYKETRLLAITNFTDQDDLTADTLALQREFNGRQYQAGIFRSSPANLVFVRETDFAGVNVGSSLDTRTDLDQSSGSDLQLFLDSRSRVDIFKDDRLVSTAVYETGNQIIDTSALPGGAYDIVLRITDSSGNVREEPRFYVKTHRLPPLDQMLWFVDAGELVVKQAGATLPESTGNSLFRAGIGKRLTPSFGLESGIIASEGDVLFESGFFKLGRAWEFRLNAGAGNDNEYGVNVDTRLRFGRARLHTNLRRIWLDSAPSLIGDELTQANLNLTVPIGRATMNLTGRYNDRPSFTDRNIGLRLDFPIHEFGGSTLDTSFSLTRDNGDVFILLRARFRLTSGSWQNEISPRLHYDDLRDAPNDKGLITNISSTWQDEERYQNDVRFTMRAVDERADKTLEAEADIASNFGRTNIDTVYSTERETYSYGANFYASILANRNTFSFGGKSQARSAVVLDIDGDARDASFDVYVNNSFKTNARIGEQTIVSLGPYETYDMELEPRGDAIVNFDNQIKTATLYPGNVVTLAWRATRIVVAFGQVLDENGEPVGNALLEGVSGLATTDEFGLFQAELDSSTTALTARTRESECRVILPDFDATQTVVTLGELTCLPRSR